MDATTYQDYVNILHEELVPAMGCTEPIAIAYAAAVARIIGLYCARFRAAARCRMLRSFTAHTVRAV